jgi:cellulose synthase/poly-beta-1,6-N-acetylglucosamine synthase-like glycosyltransferase
MHFAQSPRSKMVAECRAQCLGAEVYVLSDLQGACDGADVIVTGPITMAAKRNKAAAVSTAQYLAFIDSDAFPTEGWLQSAIAILESQPDTLIVGGPNVSPPNELASERWVGRAQRSFLLTGAYAFRKTPGSAARYVDDLPSCNMVLRRTEFLAIGGMREDLYIYEDKELCAKVVGLGRKIYFSPAVTVFHQNRRLSSLAMQRVIWGAGVWQGIKRSGVRQYCFS